MQEPTSIPMPSVLDPNRGHLVSSEESASPEERITALRAALDEACEYGQLLWRDVDALRAYLLQSLPPDPRSPGTHRVGARPTDPGDEDGWAQWQAAYAEATSVLAGPQGDSGFGVSEARREAQVRRTAPDVRMLAEHPELRQPGADRAAASAPIPNRLAEVISIAGITLAVRALLVRQLRRR